ncbi:flagellar motor switch protein FliN [Acidaminobacter sp.]|uniref:flagellar motor switch protein FliN n=1 Tax=Acidaminobacter sp. TaxID=1872102 RepID=UPI00137D7944|nr:flagellar motor switch protein FliN [Acidaminobacter sp.]
MNERILTQEEITMLLEKKDYHETDSSGFQEQQTRVEDASASDSNLGVGQSSKTEDASPWIRKPIYESFEPGIIENSLSNIDLIMDVSLEVSVVLGKTKKTIQEILSLSRGSIVELDKFAEEPLHVYVNDKLIARGEVVVINENFGIRITNILDVQKRVENFK